MINVAMCTDIGMVSLVTGIARLHEVLGHSTIHVDRKSNCEAQAKKAQLV